MPASPERRYKKIFFFSAALGMWERIFLWSYLERKGQAFNAASPLALNWAILLIITYTNQYIVYRIAFV
jgi:hypothetical protein